MIHQQPQSCTPSTVNFCNRIWRQNGKYFFKSGVHFQMRIGEEIQRKKGEKAKICTNIYKYKLLWETERTDQVTEYRYPPFDRGERD